MAEKIQIVIEVDDKGSIVVKKFGDESKKAFDEMKKGPQAAQGPLASLQESWVGLTAKVAAATAVVYGIGRTFASFVNEAAEAEQIENRLKFALETVGYTWQYAKGAVDEFANSLQATTRFSDEQARQALTDMMLYTNDFAKAQMGAKLAMDMSIRTGQDLHSASRLIGMAMSGNVEMLGRYIPQLRNLDAVLGSNATMADKAAYTFNILRKMFGGTAQADIDSYAGKLAQFKNAWSDFKEKIGNEILPPLKELLDTLKKITEEITKEPPYKEIPLAKFWGMEITRRVPLKGEELQEVLLQRQRQAAYRSKQLAAETKPDVLPGEKSKAEAEEFDPRTIVDQVRGAIAQINREYEALGIAALEANQKMIDVWDIKEPDIVDQVGAEIAQANREYEALGIAALEANQKMVDAWGIPSADEILKEIDRVVAGEERLGEAAVNLQELQESSWRMAARNISETVSLWNTLGKNIMNTWSTHVSNIVKGAETIKDGLRNIFKGMADAFISEVTRMIVQWLLYESVTKGGKTETKFLGSGSGVGTAISWIGSAIGLQEGGQFWVNKPTPLLVGEGGQREFVSVTPESEIPTEIKFLGSGSGVGTAISWLGSAIGLQEGGQFWVNKPTPLLVGEGGEPEYISVTPKSKMQSVRGEKGESGGRQITQNFYLVQAVDPESMDRALRNRSGTIVKIAGDDIRAMGLLRNAVKGA